ncbi:MAG: hypothetical protein IKR97_01305, partial [Eubacterium sp.]|nr:hypothetical protein [Eubacterium sp.]
VYLPIIFDIERGAPLCPVAVPKICFGLGRRQILTAATPYCSLHLPPAALANVPTSIRLRIYKTQKSLFNTLLRPIIVAE